MKLTQAIEYMNRALTKHGDVEVFFDCPKCQLSFTPTRMVDVALHLVNESPGDRGSGKQS